MADIGQDHEKFSWEQVKSEFSANFPATKPEETKLTRFFRKFNRFFQPKDEPHVELRGRIHELQKNAGRVLLELTAVKNELKNEIDPSLFAFVEAVVDPLMKEVQRIQKEIQQNDSMTEQYTQIFKRYTVWIEKAKMWVELCSNRNKKEGISKAVIEHNIQEFNAIVDRDLQVVSDYFNHALDHYKMNEEHRMSLKTKLEQEVLPHIAALQDLQKKPRALSLGDLSHWRAEFDQRREKYFSEALHAIDTLMQKENPTFFDEEENENYIDILLRMSTLEEKISDLAKIDLSVASQKKLAIALLTQLEEEAHHLNVDLRLSQESSERLQSLIQHLADIHQKLE